MELSGLLKGFAFLWMFLFGSICIALPLTALAQVAGTHWSKVFDPVVLSIMKVTLGQALFSTVISGFFGLLLGLKVGKGLVLRPHSRIQTLLLIPFAVPTVVAGMAWVSWLGRTGVLARWGMHFEFLYSLNAVILAHAFFNIPWVALNVAQARRQVPQDEIEAAIGLGSHKWGQFQSVIWPHVRWSFASSCAQVMSLCAMSFALVMILGGGPPVQTLETEIYGRVRYQTLNLLGDLSGAVACAVWELLITLFPWILVLFFRRKQSALQSKVQKKVREENKDGIEWTICFAIALLLIAPYFVVFDVSSVLHMMSLKGWSQVQNPLLLSLGLASVTSFIVVFTAAMAMICLRMLNQRSRIQMGLSIFLNLPGGISIFVMGLGVWLAYGQWFDPYEGGGFALGAIGMLQVTLFFPIVFRIFWPFLQSTQKGQCEAALMSGATPLQAFWWIEMPRWKGPLLSALAIVAGLSLGEVGAVSLFYSEKWVPLPMLISRWMGQYRFEEAQGVAGLLFLLSFLLIVGSFELGNRVLKPNEI